MKCNRIIFAYSLTFFLFGMIACAPVTKTPDESNGLPVIKAVNYPLAYFAERIGGNLVDVQLSEIDGDPAFWKPSVEDIVQFQKADIILLNGATYAKWVATSSLPEAKVVNTSAAFKDQYIKVKDDSEHKHGKTGKHSHAGTAFTTWLDLKLAEQQAAAIRDVLVRRLPKSEPTLQTNFAAFQKDLRKLDADLRAAAQPFAKIPLLGSHPVYQYLARGYGLNLRSVHWEPEEMPDAKGWEELTAIRKNHPASLMLWEGEPNQSIIDKLQQAGVASVVFNPCGNRPGKGDWLTVMIANVARLTEAAAEK